MNVIAGLNAFDAFAAEMRRRLTENQTVVFQGDMVFFPDGANVKLEEPRIRADLEVLREDAAADGSAGFSTYRPRAKDAQIDDLDGPIDEVFTRKPSRRRSGRSG